MTHPEQVGLSSKRLQRIRPNMEKYVGPDKMSGIVTLIARRGEVVHLDAIGLAERETNTPMATNTIFRIYSMTKLVTSAALLTLYEQGHFQLTTPAATFIPAFNDLQVYAGEDPNGEMRLEPLARPVTIRDLMTHMSGLSYHWLNYGPVETLYRESGVSTPKPLDQFVEDLLKLPLAFQPGTRWRYSYAHDVCARLVEIISGKSFDAYLKETFFDPLGMSDTDFYVPESKLDRFAAMYGSVDVLESETTIESWFGRAMAGENNLLASPTGSLESSPHNVMRGGHGLVSTAEDYLKFGQMLLNNGRLNGEQFMGRKTIEVMTANHIPEHLLPWDIGGMPTPGYGYGLGVQRYMDHGSAMALGSIGEFGWLGAANTSCWIDPVEEMVGILMAQFQPSGFHPATPTFRTLAYQAIVD